MRAARASRWTAALLYPLDDSLTPGISQAERQDGDEEQDLYEAEETELLKDHGTGENEHDIDIEGNEEQGEDVEGERILDPRGADRRLTRLVDCQLVFGGLSPQQERVQCIRQR